MCENEILSLEPNTVISNPQYSWSTNELSESIEVDTPGTYTVEISGDNCAFEMVIYEVTLVLPPVIMSIETEGQDIVVTLANDGDYLFSLDNVIYQRSNRFSLVEGGIYTIYVINEACDYLTTAQHLHFFIPRYFTPNNDGNHDVFSLAGIEFFGDSEVSIFDRYGKLLKYSKNSPFFWDGRYNNALLPTADYWYKITIDGSTFTGHFTLKR